MTVEIFVQIFWTVFEVMKDVRKQLILGLFGLILALFLTIQSYNFDAIAHIRPYHGVK